MQHREAKLGGGGGVGERVGEQVCMIGGEDLAGQDIVCDLRHGWTG